jgi:thiamine biosynthesis protein ThiS
MSDINRQKKIEVVVNGNIMLLENGVFIDDLISLLNVGRQRYVVVINDEIIPKSMHHKTQLKQSDRCDIMSPISGG